MKKIFVSTIIIGIIIVLIFNFLKKQKAIDYLKRNNVGFSKNTFFDLVKKGNLVSVKMLLEAGMDINSRDESDCTALHWAGAELNMDMIELLIDYNADLYAKDNQNASVLHYSIMSAHPYNMSFNRNNYLRACLSMPSI
jgi:ankyrin repeat protein